MFITTYSGQLGHLHLVVYIQIILKMQNKCLESSGFHSI